MAISDPENKLRRYLRATHLNFCYVKPLFLPGGTPTCWRFREITAESFHWIGEAPEADGETWKPESELPAAVANAQTTATT